MEYEYVALEDQPRDGPRWGDLIAQGWQEWMKIPFWIDTQRCSPGQRYIFIMRRSKDQQRMWTKEELQELMKETWLVERPPPI